MPEPRRRATVADVAALAEVSVASVSRHLTGHRVRQAERIDRAVAALDYRRNDSARALRSGRTGVIALVAPNVASTFTAIVVGATEAVAREHGLTVALYSGESAGDGLAVLTDQLRNRVDGAIVIPWSVDDHVVRQLADDGLPLVLLDGMLGPQAAGIAAIDSVRSDNVRSGVLVAEHFIALGHRRLGVITGRMDTSQSQERLHGYRTAIGEAGIRLAESDIAYSTDRPDGGYAAFTELLGDAARADRPTAVFVSSAPMAGGAYRAARDLGVSIPADVSVAAIDNQAFDDLWSPPITYVERNLDALGRRAAELLLARLQPAGALVDALEALAVPAAPNSLVLPVDLVVRASSAPPHS
jgi:LacI family transcriptional regulator